MSEPVNPIDELLPVICQAVAEWKAKHTPETIKAIIKKRLDEHSQEVTMKLLGFDNHWGKWELDHCNGRSGESAAGDFIRNAQKEAIREWLTTVCLPDVSPEVATKLKAQAQRVYEDYMQRELYQYAEKKAKEDMQNLVDSITKSNDIDKYLQAMKLINL